jgi:hypothetical protein
MATRRKLNKGIGKKQSRRIKYGGMNGMVYQTTYDPVESGDVILTSGGDVVRAPKKSSNEKYLLFGGGLLVALIVGVTVPLVLKNKK